MHLKWVPAVFHATSSHLAEHISETKFSAAKRKKRFQTTIKQRIRDAIFISLGILSAGFGLRGFLLPNQFIDGGVVGISLLLSEVSGWSLSLLLIVINVPFILLGFKTVNIQFAIKTAMAITVLAAVVAILPYPQITHDKLLVSIFGGFFLGCGIGLAIRGGAVIDGTEILAIFLSRKFGQTIGDIILLINVLIFSAAAYLLGIETALYAMLTYLAASKTVDFIIEGIEEYTGVTIISVKHDEIRDFIRNQMGRGLTIYKGERGGGKTGNSNLQVDIIYTVVTRLEINRLQQEIEKLDPSAFIVTQSVKDTRGGMINKRPLKH